MNKRLVTMAVLLGAATTQLFATEGINLIGIGPIQQGTAGAGVASAKDSTWLIFNPAGLVDVERGVDASFQVFAPRRSVNSDPWSGGAGKQEDNSAFVIPSISSSFGCCHGENGFVGIGIYGTSGMGVDYHDSRIGSPFGGDRKTELSIAKMTMTYAYKLGDSGLSIGAGPIFVVSQFKTDMLNPKTFQPESNDLETALGGGAIIGINQKVGKWAFGASYMSEQWMQEFDEYDDLLDDSMNLPQQATVGVAYNVLDNVELVLDYRWLGWGKLDTLGDQFGWDDQRIYKAGVTWGVTDALTLRSGVSYGESPIGDDQVFANALFPAIMETHLACGASYAWEKWSAHAAYVHALKNHQTESKGVDMPGMPGFGKGTKISMAQNSLTLGVTRHF
jgi:long-chain fatty acid transport protein